MIIGIPVYQKVDLLDVAGPYEIFNWVNTYAPSAGFEVYTIAADSGIVTTRDGMVLKPHKRFDEVPKLDVLWVPGGDPSALTEIMNDSRRIYLDFLVSRAAGAQWVASVCEGAMLLAAAGLLDGYLATTHWAFIPCFARFPKIKVAGGNPRFVVDRNRITGGGISSGLDESLKLVELIAGTAVAQQVQMVTQYFPCPPVSGAITPATSCPL
jgi:cyclohexyl-isocyanide hydratase